MKRYFHFIIICLLGCVGVFTSCTDDSELSGQVVEPGVYTIEMNVDASQPQKTRGVVGTNNDFDFNYDPDYIYLHKKGEGDGSALRLPVYTYSCDGKKTCKGFRYRIEVGENNTAKITPIDADGNAQSASLELGAQDACYFSSLESDQWELPESQQNQMQGYNFFLRKNDINKEIYRSKEDFDINALATSSDIVMNRACAGFNLVGQFYDGDEMSASGESGYITLTEKEFEDVMGSKPETWYIKIFIGGSGFTDKYDIENQQSVGDEQGGYYSSGDSKLFEEGNEDESKFLKFTTATYGYGSHYLQGYGYYTRKGNQLFTPVVGDQDVNVYILIKHWTGNGEPSQEWLLNDMGALQTKMNITGNIAPVNNCFYILGLLMDIRQFKAAWDQAGGDEAAGAMTRSSNGIREFTLKDAKVVYEVY